MNTAPLRLKRLLPILVVGACALGQAPSATIDAEIKGALVNRIDDAHRGIGIAVGILTADGARYITHGVADKTTRLEVGQDTLFEVGSLTKVFTALLLADAIERGEMKLDDPIAQYLPKKVTVPDYDGKSITLVDLATHTSGLPPNPANLDAPGIAGGYARYTTEQLYEYLSDLKLTRAPGTQWEYSNTGMGLLAHILSLHAGVSYEELLRTRILKPLGMNSTTIALSKEQQQRMATGYDADLNPVGLTDFGGLVGAGGIRATAADMLRFAAAELGFTDHPLKAAMARMRSITRPGPAPAMVQHLGWREIRAGEGILFHNGGSAGFRAALAIRPETQTAVVALANAVQDVDDLAVHGVYSQQPLAKFGPPVVRTEIRVSEDILADYAGVYQIAPTASVEISRDGSQLFLQGPNQPKLELFAEQETLFFLKAIDAQVKFVRNEAGKVTGLELHQNGASRAAQKVR